MAHGKSFAVVLGGRQGSRCGDGFAPDECVANARGGRWVRGMSDGRPGGRGAARQVQRSPLAEL